MRLGNIEKLTCWHPKVNSDNMNIVSFFFIFLILFNFLRRQKNNLRFKIILTSITFLVCSLYKFLERLKSCFTCQFFTTDTIEITNELIPTLPG